jgi:hypothetical protein
MFAGCLMPRPKKPPTSLVRLPDAVRCKADAVARYEGFDCPGDVIASLVGRPLDERFAGLPQHLRDRAIGRIERTAAK